MLVITTKLPDYYYHRDHVNTITPEVSGTRPQPRGLFIFIIKISRISMISVPEIAPVGMRFLATGCFAILNKVVDRLTGKRNHRKTRQRRIGT